MAATTPSSASAAAANAAAANAAAPHDERHHGADEELPALARFTPTDSWDLVPGDVLYLPPGVPHHGVAVGDGCTTWSIGYRAPSAADVVLHVAEALAERLPEIRLRDAGVGRTAPGEIDEATIDAVERLWTRTTALGRDTLAELAGRLLTRPHVGADARAEPDETDGPCGTGTELENGRAPGTPVSSGIRNPVPHPFARLGWSGPGERVRLFADGECLTCSRRLAVHLCDGARRGEPLPDALDALDRTALETLLERGVLLCGGGPHG